jgi:predicted ATP-grasp superfamily ATP-dependent carboligase
MRILVHEFVSGGGFAGRPAPSALAREGAAMRDALVADLAALRRHRIVATVDRRFPLPAPPAGVEVVPLRRGGAAGLEGILAKVEAAWLVAPETNGCLEGLAARAERHGVTLLGPNAAAIRRAADKAGLPRRLARRRVPHPETRAVASSAEARAAAEAIGFPVVVKPALGAGCAGVGLARRARELAPALRNARLVTASGPLLVQRFVPGVAASVSVLVARGRTAILAVNAQSMRGSRSFSYRGGTTPLDHPLARRAVALARRVCRALPGLRGYVGVDMVLASTEAWVIEVNPRLTTAYLGVRSALPANVAGLVLAACGGRLPAVAPALRRVRFAASGRILASTRLPRPAPRR